MTQIFVKGDTFVLLNELVRVDVACCGECCGGVWRTSVGECCGGEWINDDGTVEGREGTWVCCPDSNGVATVGVLTAADPGCVGGFSRCCTDGECSDASPEECLGEVLSGSCANFGCPKSCCSENVDGLVSCETVDEMLCVSPRLVDEEPCESACKGACCIDGELVEGSPKTQSECEELGGAFQGIGTTSCVECDCREPFDCDCCEEVESKGAGLTFYQPRRKRKSPWSEGTFRVTATVTTASPVLVHGVLVEPNSNCNPTDVEFLLCWESFNVEPVPCGSNFSQLKIKVCWEDQAVTAEALTFSGCNNITITLGFCVDSCVTTMTYVEAGHTSNAVIQLRGDAVIEANGTGPLVLTSNITHAGSCDRKLTLSGTSTQANEISGVIQDSSSGLSVVKTGTGLWRLSGANAFTGQLKVETGTLVVADDVGASGASPIGDVSGSSSMPLIGTSTSGANFFLDNVTMSRGAWTVAAGSGTVAIGGIGTGTAIFATSYTTRLGRDVTLQAGSGGTARFGNTWQDTLGGSNPAVAFTIGSAGNDGTVVLESDLPTSITSLTLVTGTLKPDFNDRIAPTTPVTIQLATYDRDGFDQSIDSLTVTGIATFAGSGTTTVNNSLSGSGSIVNSAGTLQIDGTNTMTGSVSITGGSVVVTTVVSGPSGLNTATFTNTTLTVDFSSAPSSGQQFKLLYGSTVQSYAPTLTGAGGATATYNSSNSTLTID